MVERPFRKPKIRLHLPAQEDRCGTGALCAEAQADGVPCGELGRECETCEKAVRGSFRRGATGQPSTLAGDTGLARKRRKPAQAHTTRSQHR